MEALNATFLFLATILYLATAGAIARSLARREAPNRALSLSLMIMGLVAHGILLHNNLIHAQGLQLGFYSIAILHAWLIALLAVLVNAYRPVQGIFLIAAPLAAIELFAGSLGQASAPVALNPGTQVHVLLSIMAYSLLSIAALQAILVGLQEAALRQHKRQLLLALPALQTMERMLFELIGLGFILLSAAIISGAWVLDDPLAQQVAHKTVFTALAWLLFAVLLIGRHWRGWRGKTAVRVTLSGFALLLLGFIGSKFVLELLLN
jgi:ABC-type uncharacterized transport system permease subunit